MKTLLWANNNSVNINQLIDKRFEDFNPIEIVNSFDMLVDRLHQGGISAVLTSINSNDIGSLYQIQQLQKQFTSVQIIGLFGMEQSATNNTEGAKSSNILNLLDRYPRLMKSKQGIARDNTTPYAAAHQNVGQGSDDVRLTRRQVDVVKLLVLGKSNKQIARDLHLSEGTVKTHCMAIFKEIGVTNRTQAALRAEILMNRGAIAC